jgi:hypothetical protein
MLIIEIAALETGAHRNQNGFLSYVPDGWAVVPDNIEVPDTFPFVDIEVEGQTVIAMTPGVVPEPEPIPEPVETEATTADMAAAIMEGVNDV